MTDISVSNCGLLNYRQRVVLSDGDIWDSTKHPPRAPAPVTSHVDLKLNDGIEPTLKNITAAITEAFAGQKFSLGEAYNRSVPTGVVELRLEPSFETSEVLIEALNKALQDALAHRRTGLA